MDQIARKAPSAFGRRGLIVPLRVIVCEAAGRLPQRTI